MHRGVDILASAVKVTLGPKLAGGVAIIRTGGPTEVDPPCVDGNAYQVGGPPLFGPLGISVRRAPEE